MGEKRNLSDMRKGIMAMTKKGKARAAGDDFTAHRMPSPRICSKVFPWNVCQIL